MIDLVRCDRPLKVLIQTQFKDWSYVYQIVDSVEINLSNTPHAHNISYATNITDHVVRNEDTVSINGSISCIRGCRGRDTRDFNLVIADLKQLKEEMLYSRDRFATLTSNDWLFKYAVLTEVNISESQDRPQEKTIKTSWKGSNFAGLVQSAMFERGGIVF